VLDRSQLTTRDRLLAPERFNNRALGLDVLRGVGALAVVILHVSVDPLVSESLLGRAPLIYLLPNLATRFAVPAFVLLSGLGLSLSANQNTTSYLSFLARRASKILPAYIAWSLIYSWTMPATPDSASLQGCVRELFAGTASFHLYFVTTILRLYVLYRAILYVVRRFAMGAAALCALSWLMIWLQPIVASSSAGAWLLAIVPLRWVGYFAVGLRSAQLDRGVQDTPVRSHAEASRAWIVSHVSGLVALVSLVLLIVITRHVVQQTRAIDVALGDAEWLILPYTLGLVDFLMGFRYRPNWPVRALGFISKHSYGLYLSHVLTLELVSLALSTFDNHASLELSFAAEIALGLPLTVIGAVLSDRLGAFCRQQLAIAWAGVGSLARKV
jgi:peptidoglycan/LPS O-acetylase OafA/YrhL